MIFALTLMTTWFIDIIYLIRYKRYQEISGSQRVKVSWSFQAVLGSLLGRYKGSPHPQNVSWMHVATRYAANLEGAVYTSFCFKQCILTGSIKTMGFGASSLVVEDGPHNTWTSLFRCLIEQTIPCYLEEEKKNRGTLNELMGISGSHRGF